MAQGVLTIRTRSATRRAASLGFLQTAKRVVIPALAVYPSSSTYESSEMGTSAIDETHSEQGSESSISRPSFDSLANAIVKVAQKEVGPYKAHCTNVLLWCTSSTGVNSLNLALTEDDEASRLLLKRARQAFGPLAESLVFSLKGMHIYIYYMDQPEQPLVLLDVEAGDPNADSKIDKVLKTVESIWIHTLRADRRIAFQNWRRLTKKKDELTEDDRNRLVEELRLQHRVDDNSKLWMRVIAKRAATLVSSPETSEIANWLDGMNAKLVNRWCQEYFNENPDAVLTFRKGNRRLYHARRLHKRTFFWDTVDVHLHDFLNHISAKLRHAFESNPSAPDVGSLIRIQECNPFDFGPHRFTSEVAERTVMCADFPLNRGEKWLKFVREFSDKGGNMQSKTLVFPARNFDAALNLFLSSRDFRNLPGYRPIRDWQAKVFFPRGSVTRFEQ